jgi:hypothetical protein
MDWPAGTVLLDAELPVPVVNGTDVPTRDVYSALQREHSPVLAALEGWVRATKAPDSLVAWDESTTEYSAGIRRRNGGLFARDAYVMPDKYFDEVRLAQFAVQTDDIVSGVAETTESLAFSRMSFFASDPDEEDVYNQIAARVNLDGVMRQVWRELFTVSQCYVAVWWQDHQTFKVRGTTAAGNARRKTIECRAPTAMTILDPLKVIPVGNTLFGAEQLAYIGNRADSERFGAILDATRKDQTDEVVSRLIVSRYVPKTQEETVELTSMGVDVSNLWLLNPANVFCHAVTRADYQRVSPVRMRSSFELLDMKRQLRQMERAHLIGGTNFILLITKGSDDIPAKQEEIQALQAQVRTVSRTPILVGDHRLSVEIITPKLDNTLKAERWNTIDSRLSARLYQMFMLGNYSAGTAGDDSIKLVKVIAAGMESRRHMIRRSFERHVFRPLFDGNEQFTTPPKLQFHPRSIALDFDPAYASFLFDLRQSNELSRETILNQFDLDQRLEAENRQREQEEYDDIFRTQVPFSTPNPANPANPADPSGAPNEPAPPETPPPRTRDNGGGRRNGGGAAPGTGQGQPPRRRPARTTAAEESPAPPMTIQLTITPSADGELDAQAIRSALRAALAPDEGDERDGET